MNDVKVSLKLKFKDDEIKSVNFDTVENIIVDYLNNKLSIFDYSVGSWYHYHFKEIGNEGSATAISVLDFKVEVIENE